MQTYELFIEDDRYSVRTLQMAEYSTDDEAIEFAREVLTKSSHYSAVEVVAPNGRVVAYLLRDMS